MINCPLPFGDEMLCQECRYNSDDKCWWFFPSRPLSEILTVEERLEVKSLPQPEWSGNQWDIVNQLRSEIRGWREKYNQTLNELEKLKPREETEF